MLPCSKEKGIDPSLCFIYKNGEKTEDMKYYKTLSKWLPLKEETSFEEK